MPAGMRDANGFAAAGPPRGSAPTSPIGHPDVLWGLPGQGGLLTEWAETVPDLTWPESVRTYGRMRRDARITALLASYWLPIIRTTWAIDPEGIDRAEAVDLVSGDLGLPVLGEKGMPSSSPVPGFTWHDHVRLALLSQVYGHMPFERWFEARAGRTHLAGISERQPHTISIMDIDENGLMSQVWQNTQDQPIPANRLTWYVHEREGANWAGVSMLRSCYTPWILKHETLRVHATSIRRFGMGVPNVEAPAGATPGQIAQAQQLAAQMRVGDTAGAGLPNGFKFNLTGLSGSAPDALGFLTYLNQEITTSALAQIIELGHGTYGTRALGESFLDLFLLSLQASADAIGDTATYGDPTMPGIAKALVEYNWGEGEPVPRIVATDVGDRHEITAAAISQMITAGAISPDPNLEAFLREAWGLPERSQNFPPPVAQLPYQPKGEEVAGPAGGGSGSTGEPSPAPTPTQSGGEPATSGPEGNPASPQVAQSAARRGGRLRRWPFRGRADAEAGLRRPLTETEAKAGMEPLIILSESRDAMAGLLRQWAPIAREMHQDLTGQVAAAVDDGDLPAVANLTPDPGPAAALLTTAMRDMAWTGALRMIREAATQGVTINPAAVTLDDTRIAAVAQARASLIAARLAHEASRAALQVVHATAGTDAGDAVSVRLAGLSPTPLADQLLAAMNAAQNMGRIEAANAGIADGASAIFIATEILDDHTCVPCQEIDGTQFASQDEAEAAYANGGYVECDGRERCRGTVITDWGDTSASGQLDGSDGTAAGDSGDSADDGGLTIADLMDVADQTDLPDWLVAEINGTYGDGGLTAEVNTARSYVSVAKSTGMRIVGDINAPDGTKAGEFVRRIHEVPVEGTASETKLVAENWSMEIDGTYQGQGFASAFNRQMENLYRQAGIGEVRLTANLTVGGYAWARTGFDWATKSSAEVIGDRFRAALIVAKSVASGAAERPAAAEGFAGAVLALADDPAALAQAEALTARLASEPFGSAGYPTPYEFSIVGWKPGAVDWPGKDLMLGSGWDAVKTL